MMEGFVVVLRVFGKLALLALLIIRSLTRASSSYSPQAFVRLPFFWMPLEICSISRCLGIDCHAETGRSFRAHLHHRRARETSCKLKRSLICCELAKIGPSFSTAGLHAHLAALVKIELTRVNSPASRRVRFEEKGSESSELTQKAGAYSEH